MLRNLIATAAAAAFTGFSAHAQVKITPAPELQAVYSPAEQRAMDDYKRLPPPQAYLDCDGYGAPTTMGDGMTSYAFAYGIFRGSGDQRRNTPKLSSKGAPACDVALKRLEEFPSFKLRRASLWRARAVHRLAAGEVDKAMADLDLSEQALNGSPDIYHQRSLKLGIDLLRAYVLRIRGDQTGAERMALAAFQSRPYSRTVGFAALIASGENLSPEALETLARMMARITPDALDLYYDEMFERGRYQDVVAMHPSLIPPIEHGDEPMEARQKALLEQRNRVSAEVYRVRTDGERAYALAALGRSEDARRVMADAQARAAAAETPAPPLPAKPKTADLLAKAAHEQGNLEMRTQLPPILAVWSRLVEARLLVSEGKYREALDRFDDKGAAMPPTSATIEFLLALKKAVPEFQFSPKDEQTMRDQLRKIRATAESKNLISLFEALPETETAKRVPRDGKLGGLLEWVDGYSAKPRTDGQPGMVVALAGISATAAMTQEGALLKAAELALADGKDSLLVLDDIDIRRTVINTYYSNPVSQDPQGFITRLEVVFVDADAVPPAFRSQAWRLLDARAVQAALAPVYRPRKVATK